MRIKRPGSGIQEGDMTPMIDMTFQLIAFFMVLINFTQSEQNERIQLPDSELAKPPEAPLDFPITIHLTRNEDLNGNGALDTGEDANKNGKLDDCIAIIGGQEVPIEGLSPILGAEARVLIASGEPLSSATVIIRGHREARTGKVQDLIRECQKIDFEKFALRAREDVGNN